MKKKALVLAVCMALGTPAVSMAKTLPSDLLGLNLGEIQAKSFLNEPFKGIIPILFTDIEASKRLKIRLAPHSIFQKMGAEKLPVLNSLKFEVSVENNKPVILISSPRPIQMPFLNFILEIESSQGSIYQDYTTLLDPREHAKNIFSYNSAHNEKETLSALPSTAQVTEQGENLLLESYSSSSVANAVNKEQKHIVKSGDTLSEIAQALNAAEVSLKKMVAGIHRKNPKAFINNDINRLKAGAVLQIPTQHELTTSAFKIAAKVALKKKHSNINKVNTSKKMDVASTTTTDGYKIERGDNLSQITRKLGHKGVSFTKMMKAIHTANPHAFSKNKINLLKVGEILRIPSIEEVSAGKPSVVQVVPQSAAKKQASSFVDPNLIILDDANKVENIQSSENGKEFKLEGFVVEKGDTLASITKQIGHKGISFSKMMKAIYTANPEAFQKDNVTTLIEGSIIRLPSIVEIDTMDIEKKTDGNKSKTKPTPTTVIPEATESNLKIKSNMGIVNLEKRLREVRRELYKARANFSHLKLSLVEKEALLKEQSHELKELASALELAGEESNGIVASPLQNNNKTLVKFEEPITPEDTNTKRKLLRKAQAKKQDVSEALLAAQMKNGYVPMNIGETLANTVKNNIVDYSKYMSDKEMLSSALALLFGLMLIRYRREIYNYTKISYEHPSYYPPLGAKEARDVLKEKPINFLDPLVDSNKKLPTEVAKSGFSSEDISECEELVSELVGDLGAPTTRDDNINWDEINKTCDAYIAEYKNTHRDIIEDKHEAATEQSERNEMSFELFEALAKGAGDKLAHIQK